MDQKDAAGEGFRVGDLCTHSSLSMCNALAPNSLEKEDTMNEVGGLNLVSFWLSSVTDFSIS